MMMIIAVLFFHAYFHYTDFHVQRPLFSECRVCNGDCDSDVLIIIVENTKPRLWINAAVLHRTTCTETIRTAKVRMWKTVHEE